MYKLISKGIVIATGSLKELGELIAEMQLKDFKIVRETKND